MELLQQLIEFTANGNIVPPTRTLQTTAPKTEKPKLTRKYDDDINALAVFYSMEPGTVITIELKDLLTICPRNRQRIDGYRGLVSALAAREVVLDIKSRKTK